MSLKNDIMAMAFKIIKARVEYLQLVANISEENGKIEQAKKYSKHAKRLKRALNILLDDEGCYN